MTETIDVPKAAISIDINDITRMKKEKLTGILWTIWMYAYAFVHIPQENAGKDPDYILEEIKALFKEVAILSEGANYIFTLNIIKHFADQQARSLDFHYSFTEEESARPKLPDSVHVGRLADMLDTQGKPLQSSSAFAAQLIGALAYLKTTNFNDGIPAEITLEAIG